MPSFLWLSDAKKAMPRDGKSRPCLDFRGMGDCDRPNATPPPRAIPDGEVGGCAKSGGTTSNAGRPKQSKRGSRKRPDIPTEAQDEPRDNAPAKKSPQHFAAGSDVES